MLVLVRIRVVPDESDVESNKDAEAAGSELAAIHSEDTVFNFDKPMVYVQSKLADLIRARVGEGPVSIVP